MKKRTKASTKTASAPRLCDEAGLFLRQFLQRIRPPEEARQHFQAARVEVLKGLRAVLDARIEQRTKGKARGAPIKVE